MRKKDKGVAHGVAAPVATAQMTTNNTTHSQDKKLSQTPIKDQLIAAIQVLSEEQCQEFRKFVLEYGRLQREQAEKTIDRMGSDNAKRDKS